MILPWHQNAFAKLRQMIDQNHLPHALLITGLEKIGKFELAGQLLKAILCKNNSCGKCHNCQAIKKDSPRQLLDDSVLIRRSHYPNMIYCTNELNDKGVLSKEIRVDQIRAFCQSLEKTAQELQVGMIFYADQLNINAANSLLKTLEEPRQNTLIILLAHNRNSLPATILSRCQSVHISPTFEDKSVAWVSNHIDKDKRQDFSALQLLENAHGVPFRAVADLEGDYFLQYQNWQNHLLEMTLNPLKASESELFDGQELEALICLRQLVTQAIRLKVLRKEGALMELNKVIEKTSAKYFFKLLDDINRAILMSQTSVNIKLLFDNILIVWSHITHLKKYPVITIPRTY